MEKLIYLPSQPETEITAPIWDGGEMSVACCWKHWKCLLPLCFWTTGKVFLCCGMGISSLWVHFRAVSFIHRCSIPAAGTDKYMRVYVLVDTRDRAEKPMVSFLDLMLLWGFIFYFFHDSSVQFYSNVTTCHMNCVLLFLDPRPNPRSYITYDMWFFSLFDPKTIIKFLSFLSLCNYFL